MVCVLYAISMKLSMGFISDKVEELRLPFPQLLVGLLGSILLGKDDDVHYTRANGLGTEPRLLGKEEVLWRVLELEKSFAYIDCKPSSNPPSLS